MQHRLEYVASTLLEKVARSREAELEASGRASGLQVSIEVLRNQVATLQQTNDMLISRAFNNGAPMAPAYHAPMANALPSIVGGIPAGSPRPSQPHLMHLESFDPGLPAPPPSAPRAVADYASGGMNDLDPFSDMGDEQAQRRGIKVDDLTGSLEGGTSMPVPRM